jgi:hypothetical protein
LLSQLKTDAGTAASELFVLTSSVMMTAGSSCDTLLQKLCQNQILLFLCLTVAHLIRLNFFFFKLI